MIRPYLVNFSAIISENQLSIRASLSKATTPVPQNAKNISSTPIQSLSLFRKDLYRIKIKGLDQNQQIILNKEFDSDNYGNFEIRLPAIINGSAIQNLLVYEVSIIQGLDLHLGSFIPLQIANPKKIVISDFDKTLVDTKYHTPKEVYYSLNKPLSYFPTVQKSIDILTSLIDKGHQPFILSASPHFYENAIRDWLYQHQIFVSNIFLKDYRDFFSIFDGRLSTKDLKVHGFHKINKLIDILLMTGIPDELVLIGDGFESDPFIYLTLVELLEDKTDPLKLWRSIKNHNFFNLTSKQDSIFITKFYQLYELSRAKRDITIEIYIRATTNNLNDLKDKEFTNPNYTQRNKTVNYYTD